jgi:hypothetical protein
MKTLILKTLFIYFTITMTLSSYAQNTSESNLVLKVTMSLVDTVSMSIGDTKIIENEFLFLDEVLSKSATVSIYNATADSYYIEVVISIHRQGANISDLNSNEVVRKYEVKKFDLRSLTIVANGTVGKLSFQGENGGYIHVFQDHENRQIIFNQRNEPFMFK